MAAEIDQKTSHQVIVPSVFAEFWRNFSRNKGALVGFFLIVALIIVAILADLLAPYDPAYQFEGRFLLPPAWVEGSMVDHFLGTDNVGRDILSRLIHGARLSLIIGLIVVTLSLVFGVSLGLIAGYFGGWVDFMIMRLMDIIQALPSLLMALVIIAILEKSLTNAMIAISITVLPHYARLTRAAVISEINKEYVIASRVAGAGSLRLMLITLLPNCLPPLIVQATLSFSSAILDAAALGFLGYGAQPPTAEWGTMLSEARSFITQHPWIVTLPGLCILITVLAFNLMGDGLRDALDPKLKRT
ncbi:MAG TPA: ABC transporter permease subunit [Alphaproteobacteria bacterium]|jgi:dipeptide transport system permease protein|nr:ABC transporter permease subunit [Alphaproteobacteria bacterium]